MELSRVLLQFARTQRRTNIGPTGEGCPIYFRYLLAIPHCHEPQSKDRRAVPHALSMAAAIMRERQDCATGLVQTKRLGKKADVSSRRSKMALT